MKITREEGHGRGAFPETLRKERCGWNLESKKEKQARSATGEVDRDR